MAATTDNPHLTQATAFTLVLGVILVVAAGVLRYSDDTGVPEDIFRVNKVRWRQNADVLITGDSRAYIGISPQHLGEELGPDLRILNFGFNAQGYHPRYFEGINRTFDPRTEHPRLILCITPRSLTRRSEIENGFDFAEKKNRAMNWLDHRLEYVYFFCRPMRPKDLGYGILPWLRKRHFYRDFHPDGWMASDRVPRKPGTGLSEYRDEVLAKNPVDPEIVAGLIRQVAAWHQAGVCVYGLRPPTVPAMLEVEAAVGRFDEADFVARFQAAGGIWLDIDPTGYETFDDSHLVRDSAIRLSRELGRKIRALEATPEAHQP